MAYGKTLKEEEIKNRVAADLFPAYDCNRILGNVDFCVQPKNQGPMLWETESLLWAEAKNGVHNDFAPLFAQLVLTVGGEKTFDKHSPPPFLGEDWQEDHYVWDPAGGERDVRPLPHPHRKGGSRLRTGSVFNAEAYYGAEFQALQGRVRRSS